MDLAPSTNVSCSLYCYKYLYNLIQKSVPFETEANVCDNPFVRFKELPQWELQAFASFLFGWPPQTIEEWIHSSALSTMNIRVRCRQELVAAARLVHGDAV